MIILRVYRLTTLVWCPSKMFICSIYFTIDNAYPTPHCFRTKQNSPKTDCLVVEPTPLKNMTSSVGMEKLFVESHSKFHGSKHFPTNQQKKAFTKWPKTIPTAQKLCKVFFFFFDASIGSTNLSPGMKFLSNAAREWLCHLTSWTWLKHVKKHEKNMGLSENRVYSQWNSHLIGIMIINHWV